MRKLILSACALCAALLGQAQLSGTKAIPGDFPTIKAATIALNTQGVGAGGVIFNVAAGHTESSTDSINLTATGTAANPIQFRKAGTGANPVITRTGSGSLTTTALGAAGDAVLSIEGSDYVTLDGIDITAASQGIEYGYLVRRASATDGVKTLTIQNARVTMTKGTSALVIGIHITNVLRGGSLTSATGVTVTSIDGRHDEITIKGNTVTGAFVGIYARGYAAPSPYDLHDFNLTIGAAGAGNVIENFAGNAASTAYGIYVHFQREVSITYNTVNNTAGGGTGATALAYGIFLATASGGNFSANNNTVNMTTSSATANLFGIYNDVYSGTGSFNDNTITLNTTAATSGDLGYIRNDNATAGTTFQSNVFVGSTVNTTGDIWLIWNDVTFTGPHFIRNNSVSGTLVRSGASGATYGYFEDGTAVQMEEISGNNFSNITQGGTSSFNGIFTSPSAGATQIVTGNTISNISTGSGLSYCIHAATANSREISGNLIFNINASGTIHGIFSTTGMSDGAIQRNKIYGISGTATASLVYGITVAGGTNTLIQNNLVGNLTAPVANSGDAIRGINITATTANSNIKVYFNTIYLNAASTGGTFGTSGIYATQSTTATSATLDLRNNIVVNTSTATNGGLTSAYRRNGTTLANFSTLSNNNLYYAGAPSPTNLIFYDGNNTLSTLAAYQALVGAEGASVSVMPAFLSTTGSDATFLHINPAIPTRIESGGMAIAGLNTDFDNDTRGTVPDIGADEFAGTPLPNCSGTPSAGTITGSGTVCNGKSLELSLSGHSTEANITYEWRSSATPGGPYTAIAGATGSTINTGAVTATTYYVAVVRCPGSGISVTTPEFALSVLTVPVVTVTPQHPMACGPGSSVTLTASGASTYSWLPATELSATTGATVTATPTASRNYTVTGTAANGCTATASAIVGIAPAIVPTVSATPSVFCASGNAQLQAALSAADLRTYAVDAIPHAPLTATGTPTVLANNGAEVQTLSSGTLDDGRWTGIPLGFTFNFFNTDFTAINISTNGFITFGTQTEVRGFGVEMPTAAAPNNAIFLALADLDLRSPGNGRVEYFVEGTAPNRRFVVNFINVPFFDVAVNSNPGVVTIQAILHEGSNDIEIHTTAATNVSEPKAQGIENSNGTIAYAVPGRNNTLEWTSAPSAYRFRYSDLTYSWTPATFLSSTTIPNPVATSVSGTVNYTVTVTNTATGCTGTGSVTVSAGAPLAATATASVTSICPGGNVTLNAPVTGGGLPYTYSWSDGSLVVGNTGSLTVTPASTKTYTVTVSDACGQSATASVLVTVSAPTITASAGNSRCGAGTLTLTATADAGSVVNWYAGATGGVPLATGTTFTTPAISSTTTYYAGASKQGASAFVGRTAPSGTSGTNLSNWGFIFNIFQSTTLNSVDVVSTTGTSITIALYSADGSTQLMNSGARTVPAGATSAVTLGWSLAPGTYRIIATTMTGNFVRDLSGVTYPVALGAIGEITSYVTSTTANPSTGTAYYFLYNWNMTEQCDGPRVPVTATVTAATTITTQPAAQAVCAGSAATFAVSATGDAVSYQWRKGGANITGATSATFTIPAVSPSDAADYDVVVTGSCGSATSAAAALSIAAATTITTQPLSQAVCAGTSATFSGAASGSALTYQWIKDGVDIPGANGSSFTIASAAGSDVGSYSLRITGGCGTATTAQATLLVRAATTIDLQPLSQTACAGDQVFFIVNAGGTNISFQWKKDGNNIAGANNSTLAIPAVTATDAAAYTLVVSGDCGTVTSSVATLTVTAATAITTQPVAATPCPGTTASFSVVAGGSGLSYQWRKDGNPIAGATAASLDITNVSAADAGTYTVVVTGACGTVTSSPVTLVLNTCTAVPNLDADVTSVQLLPTVVNNKTLLRVQVRRAMTTEWVMTDARGQVLRKLKRQLTPGTNDLQLQVSDLSAGVYFLKGSSAKGSLGTIRFVKL